jgi:hypothetical protein
LGANIELATPKYNSTDIPDGGQLDKKDCIIPEMSLQMNSLLFALLSLPVVFNAPSGAASASRMVEEHAAPLAFVSPETSDVTLCPKLCPFFGIQMARRVDWRDHLIPSFGAAFWEF